MKIERLSPVFTKALPVLKEIISAGYEAYFVGGSVRDLLLDRNIHDVDIATSAYPEEIKRIFPHTIDTGIQHGTVTVRYDHESYEVTTFRTESGYQDFRRPDHVSFVQNLSEDLKRRDFTINALAMDIEGNIIDHFNGLDDLKNKVIRAVGVAENRFHEDALRMMRAVRFMGQLKFSLEDKTKQAIKDNHELLSKIAVERVREEFVKMGTSSGSQEAFEVFLEGYRLLSALGYPILPEGSLDELRGVKGALSHAMMWVMTKTAIGRLAATDHCRHAVAEMETLDMAWEKLWMKRSDFPMPNWDALRTAMPDWEELHRSYDK